MKNLEKKTRFSGKAIIAGLAMVGMAGGTVGCGEAQEDEAYSSLMQAAEVDAEAGPQEEDVLPNTKDPVTDYLDADGNYFLECHTGSPIPDLPVGPDADVNGWIRACMDGLVNGGGGVVVTEEQFREFRMELNGKGFGGRGDGRGGSGGTKRATPPITNFSYDGNWWAACNTGADIDAINIGTASNDEYITWRDECLSYGVGGGGGLPSLGAAHERFASRVTGTGGSNPITGGIRDAAQVRRKGRVLTCSTTGETLPDTIDDLEMREFSNRCKSHGEGTVLTRMYSPGVGASNEGVYICSTSGEMSMYSRGLEALEGLIDKCRRSEGGVFSRDFAPDTAAAVNGHRYICTTTGETMPHGNSAAEVESFIYICGQSAGTALSTVPRELAPEAVRRSAPVGQDGRDEWVDEADAIPFGNVISANDINGDVIYVCMPKGNHIGPNASYQDYSQFKYNCENSGGTVNPRPFLIYQEREVAYDIF